MDKQRIVITGIGVVAPNGIGKEAFWNNCFAGVSGIKRITLFDTSPYRCHYAGEISNFQPEQYFGPKGLRNLDRTTLLALVAAKLAIEDAHLDITDENRNDIGVVLGSTMGSVHSISEFDKEGLREGPRYVNPAKFPNTVINSPASQVAIRFGLRGLNSTISTGFTASLDAFGYAMDMLRLGRVRTLLVGGVEELAIQTFLGFYKIGFLATAQNGSPPLFAPFDARRSGTLLGEGSAFFIIERLADVLNRDAYVYAELLGYGTQFHAASMYRYDPEGTGAVAAVQQALMESQVTRDTVDHISACANSTRGCDAMESVVVKKEFCSRADSIRDSSAKVLLGESFSAGGALQSALSIGVVSIGKGFAVDSHSQHSGIAHSSSSRDNATIYCSLINGFTPVGVSSALIMAKYQN